MKSRELFFGLVVLMCLALLPSELAAQRQVNRRTGLYGERIGTAGRDNVSVSVDGLYYYGDMEVAGFSLKAPHLGNFGVKASANYHQSVARQVKMRYSLGGGYLQGNNAKYEQKGDSPRDFHSGLVSAAVGVEWFPIDNAGFYLYAGVLMQYSYVTYDIMGYQGVEHTFLPMIPLEIGYNFELTPEWHLGVHVGMAQGLIDIPGSNLDAWPQEDKFGNSPENKFPDGYVQLGLTVSYTWNKY